MLLKSRFSHFIQYYIYIYNYNYEWLVYHDLLIQYRLYVAWTGGPVVEFRLLHTVVVGSISSGGDHGVQCWWDGIRSKQLFSAPYVTYRCVPNFLVVVISNLIYIVILRHTVLLYHNPSVRLDTLDCRSWDRNLADSNANPRFYLYYLAPFLNKCYKTTYYEKA